MVENLGKHTLEAILNQDMVLEASLGLMKDKKDIVAEITKEIDTVVFTGCGSNYYMAISAATHYQHITRETAISAPASEILLFPDTVFKRGNKYLLVILSRSGETTEVVKAAECAMDKFGIKCVAIGCYKESRLSKNAAYRFIVEEAIEKSVVTTKSFSGMLLIAQLFAALKAGDRKYQDDLSKLPKISADNINKYNDYVRKIANNSELKEFAFLGSGPLYGIACEGMLKMKEMALVPSDAFHALEYRHGPKSIVKKTVLITQFISDTARKEEVALLKEVKELGGTTFVICDKADNSIADYADYLVETKTGLDEYARSVAFIPFVQLLGYYKAVSQGIDTDKPRHLTHYVELK